MRNPGARVYLTPLAVADAEEMTGVLSGDELYTFIGGHPPAPGELRVAYARQVVSHAPGRRQEWRNWIIRLDGEGTAAGYVQATIVDEGKRAEIAWVVGLKWQGQGYATAAARALVDWLASRGVTVIQAHIHPGHAASAAVARHAGLLPTDQYDDGEQLWHRELPAAAPAHVMLTAATRDP